MKEREALKLALEAWERGDGIKLGEILKKALAQPKQEPVACTSLCVECTKRGDWACAKAIPPQLEQEPVAWLDPNQTIDSYALSWYQNEIHSVPLYTITPQRTWVGLTDEEIAVVLTGDASLGTRLDELTPSWIELVKAVEAKLKEKNKMKCYKHNYTEHPAKKSPNGYWFRCVYCGHEIFGELVK